MLKCASAFTYEMDNAEIAAKEINDQIKRQVTLMDNTVGIVMCHPDFIATGVLEAISDSLPFDIIGVTSASQAVNEEYGELILTIFVITADDVTFRTGITFTQDGDVNASVADSRKETAGEMIGQEKLAIILQPFFPGTSGEIYLYAWEKIIPGVPVFGMFSMDDSTTFEECRTVYNGKAYRDGVSYILCYGNINPRFMYTLTSTDKGATYKKGLVTKADGLLLHEIDGTDALSYFKNHEYMKNMPSLETLYLTPFEFSPADLASGGDGRSFLRALFRFDENGTAIFHGNVKEGDLIMPTSCSPEEIKISAVKTAEDINKLDNVNGVLMASCIVRRMMLIGSDTFGEFREMNKVLSPGIPYMAGYVGGEICPTSVVDGKAFNRYHEYTLVVLVL